MKKILSLLTVSILTTSSISTTTAFTMGTSNNNISKTNDTYTDKSNSTTSEEIANSLNNHIISIDSYYIGKRLSDISSLLNKLVSEEYHFITPEDAKYINWGNQVLDEWLMRRWGYFTISVTKDGFTYQIKADESSSRGIRIRAAKHSSITLKNTLECRTYTVGSYFSGLYVNECSSKLRKILNWTIMNKEDNIESIDVGRYITFTNKKLDTSKTRSIYVNGKIELPNGDTSLFTVLLYILPKEDGPSSPEEILSKIEDKTVYMSGEYLGAKLNDIANDINNAIVEQGLLTKEEASKLIWDSSTLNLGLNMKMASAQVSYDRAKMAGYHPFFIFIGQKPDFWSSTFNYFLSKYNNHVVFDINFSFQTIQDKFTLWSQQINWGEAVYNTLYDIAMNQGYHVNIPGHTNVNTASSIIKFFAADVLKQMFKKILVDHINKNDFVSAREHGQGLEYQFSTTRLYSLDTFQAINSDTYVVSQANDQYSRISDLKTGVYGDNKSYDSQITVVLNNQYSQFIQSFPDFQGNGGGLNFFNWLTNKDKYADLPYPLRMPLNGFDWKEATKSNQCVSPSTGQLVDVFKEESNLNDIKNILSNNFIMSSILKVAKNSMFKQGMTITFYRGKRDNEKTHMTMGFARYNLNPISNHFYNNDNVYADPTIGTDNYVWGYIPFRDIIGFLNNYNYFVNYTWDNRYTFYNWVTGYGGWRWENGSTFRNYLIHTISKSLLDIYQEWFNTNSGLNQIRQAMVNALYMGRGLYTGSIIKSGTIFLKSSYDDTRRE